MFNLHQAPASVAEARVAPQLSSYQMSRKVVKVRGTSGVRVEVDVLLVFCATVRKLEDR